MQVHIYKLITLLCTTHNIILVGASREFDKILHPIMTIILINWVEKHYIIKVYNIRATIKIMLKGETESFSIRSGSVISKLVQ